MTALCVLATLGALGAALLVAGVVLWWLGRRDRGPDHRAAGRARRHRDPHDLPLIGDSVGSPAERRLRGDNDRPDDADTDKEGSES